MKEFDTSWSREELKVYLMIYCANADFHESKIESDFIKAKHPDTDFDAIHEEYNEDTDFQRIQKIRLTAKRHNYSKPEIDELFEEMKTLFKSDRDFDLLEANLLRELSHLIGH